MAVVMRLRRMGAPKHPSYRIVVTDIRSARGGRYIEKVGIYDPMVNPAKTEVNKERVEYWLSKGVKPTETVANILKKHGIESTPK
jgi:small subunit ribosomal protein S16